MVRKCKRMPEFAAVEMAQAGVRTRAQAQALAAGAAAVTASATATSSGTGKKRKVDNQEVHISMSYNAKIRSSDRTRRLVGTTPENSVSHSPEVKSGHHAVLEGRCSNRSSDHASASCCSSNGTSERIELADLKEESVEVESYRERSETTGWRELQAESSEGPDSTASKSDGNSSRRSAAAEKTPSEAELGEFFAEAEKNLQKQFADKYNYDIAKDEPLEGRYEWVRLNS